MNFFNRIRFTPFCFLSSFFRCHCCVFLSLLFVFAVYRRNEFVHCAFWFYVSSFGSGTSSTPNVCSYCYPHKDVIIYTISESQKYRNLSTNQPLMSNFIGSIVRVCDRRNRRTMFGDGDGPTLTLHRVLVWAQGQVGNLWSWSGSTSEVVLLGRPYDTSTEEGRDRFLNDFLSRILLTYRCDFPNLLEEASLNPSASSSSQTVSINCDAGWGCRRG